MAHPSRRRAENVAGPFYVDDTCIDCDTCRWMAPGVYADIGDQSAVIHQPDTQEERIAAYKALLACPTASIGVTEKVEGMAEALESFPDPITEDVFHCGYHSEKSFGAASYLIQRSDGNIMVDSPRYVPRLAAAIEARGGLRYLYLTHRDDVAEHRRWAEHFGCERILHRDDVSSGTRDVEIQPEGEDLVQLAPDVKIIPVPGHTRGHTVLLYREEVLFTGDHLAWSDRLGHLYAFRGATWYSWDHLKRSMRRLLDERFTRVLPGHGRAAHLPAEKMHDSLVRCIEWMESR